MRMRTVLLVPVLAATFLAPASVTAAESGTECEATFDLVIEPGFTSEPSSGTFGPLNGEPGTIECEGPVNGEEPTGPGTWTVSGNYGAEDGASCQSGGEGDGTQEWSVPTDGGEEQVVNEITFTFGALQGGGGFGGEFVGDTYDGDFEVTPKKGDCVSEPLTEITVVATFTLPS